MCEGLLAKATKLESQVSYPHVVFASQEPLRTVCLFTQLLANRNSSESNADADELIATIVESAKRMEQLICGLLDFSRLDAQTGKRFKLTEVRIIEFRAEMYNILNRANFANPPATLAYALGTSATRLLTKNAA